MINILAAVRVSLFFYQCIISLISFCLQYHTCHGTQNMEAWQGLEGRDAPLTRRITLQLQMWDVGINKSLGDEEDDLPALEDLPELVD